MNAALNSPEGSFGLVVNTPKFFCGTENIIVHQNDLGCLLEKDQWLDDSVVNATLAVLLSEAVGGCVVFNAHFYFLLLNGLYRKADKEASKMPKENKWVFPICLGNHWFSIVIDWKENIITTIDSLHKEHLVEVSILRSLLDMVEKRTWKQEQNTTIPVQTNGYDCGVLMLKAVQKDIVEDEESINMEKCIDYRKEFYKLLSNSSQSEKKSSVSVVSEAEIYNEFLEYLKQELASTDDSVVGKKAFHTQNNTGVSPGSHRPVAQTKACSTNERISSAYNKETKEPAWPIRAQSAPFTFSMCKETRDKKSIKESIVGQNQEDKELHFPEEETEENVSKSQLSPTIQPISEGDSIKESLAGENLPTKKSLGPPEKETGDNTEEKIFAPSFVPPESTKSEYEESSSSTYFGNSFEMRPGVVTSHLSEFFDKETSVYNVTKSGLEFRIYDIITFYRNAFKEYKKGDKTSLCPLCLQNKEKNKKDKIIDCDSHIFSRCFLESYFLIHGQVVDHEFIYDGISQKSKTWNNLTWILFCRNCETNVADEENLLNQFYLQIAGTSGRKMTVVRENALKVRHILAVILFRGMLLGVDILDEYEDQFWETFLSLREYCSTKLEEDGDPPYLPKFLVYVLSNEYYNKDGPKLWYHMDFLLRNPTLTSMIKINENNVFLYYKMDIFHCMFPIKTDIPIEEDKLFCEFPPFLWKYLVKHSGCQPLYTDKEYTMIIPDPIKMPGLIPLPLSMNITVLENLPVLHKEGLISEARRKSPIAGREAQDNYYSKLESKIKDVRKELNSVHSTTRTIKNQQLKNWRHLVDLKKKLKEVCEEKNISLAAQDLSSNQCTESEQTFEAKMTIIAKQIESLKDDISNIKSEIPSNKVH